MTVWNAKLCGMVDNLPCGMVDNYKHFKESSVCHEVFPAKNMYKCFLNMTVWNAKLCGMVDNLPCGMVDNYKNLLCAMRFFQQRTRLGYKLKHTSLCHF